MDSLLEGFGHTLSLEDYKYIGRESTEHHAALVGNIMQVLEAVGLPEKQESALKRLVKEKIWMRHTDFIQVLFAAAKTPYPEENRPVTGIIAAGGARVIVDD